MDGSSRAHDRVYPASVYAAGGFQLLVFCAQAHFHSPDSHSAQNVETYLAAIVVERHGAQAVKSRNVRHCRSHLPVQRNTFARSLLAHAGIIDLGNQAHRIPVVHFHVGHGSKVQILFQLPKAVGYVGFMPPRSQGAGKARKPAVGNQHQLEVALSAFIRLCRGRLGSSSTTDRRAHHKDQD